MNHGRLSRTSPNKVRLDVRGSRPSATEMLVLSQAAQFGDNGILETVAAPLSQTVSGQYRMPYKDDDTDDSISPKNPNSDFEEMEDEKEEEPQNE